MAKTYQTCFFGPLLYVKLWSAWPSSVQACLQPKCSVSIVTLAGIYYEILKHNQKSHLLCRIGGCFNTCTPLIIMVTSFLLGRSYLQEQLRQKNLFAGIVIYYVCLERSCCQYVKISVCLTCHFPLCVSDQAYIA